MSRISGEDVRASFFAQLFVALASGLSGLVLGVTVGWASPVKEPLLEGLGVFQPFPVTDNDFSWIASVVTLGHIIGSIIGGPLCDLVGRRGCLLLAAVPNIASWILVSFSSNVLMLKWAIFAAGTFGSGIITCAGHMYLNEIAETRIRGALGVLFVVMSSTGILSVVVIGPMTSVFGLSVYCGAISAIFFLVMIFTPESPFYLLKKGNETKAKKALIRLRGEQYDIEKELLEIKQSILHTEEHKMNFFEGFRTIEAKKSLFMGLALVSLEGLIGSTILITYINDLFQSAGVSVNPNVSAIIASTFPVIGTLVSSVVVDRVGRRPLLMLAGCVTAVSSFIIATFFILKDSGSDITENLYFRFVPLVSVSVYLFFYALGFGPVEWIYMSEIVPPRIRGPAASICSVCNGIFTFIVTFSYLYSVQGIGRGPTFCIFGGFSVILFLLARFVLIETKGKSFEEIQVELRG